MKIELFCETAYLNIKPEDIYHFESFKISQTRNFYEMIDLIRSQEAIANMGVTRLDILSSRPYLYTYFDIEKFEQTPRIMQKAMEYFTQIISSLWFIRNNSCNITAINGVVDKNKYCFGNSNIFFSNAEGTHEFETFSKEEWDSAINYFKRLAQEFPQSPIDEGIITAQITRNTYHFGNFNSITRITRALTFLSIARYNPLLPAKISYYVVVLECLFSGDDSGEITHKISQRIANYIGATSEDKSKIFRFVKETYKVRSKYLHGQQLTSKHDTRDKLLPMSIELDKLLRSIFQKIALDKDPFLKDSETLKAWLDDEMF